MCVCLCVVSGELDIVCCDCMCVSLCVVSGELDIVCCDCMYVCVSVCGQWRAGHRLL